MIFLDNAIDVTGLFRTLRALPWSTLVYAMLLLVGGILLVRILMWTVTRLLNRTKLDGSLHRFIKSVIRFILYFVVLVSVVSFLGLDVTSFIALLSVFTLAITLSVQTVLSNVAGGIMLMGTKPFKKGDYVSIEGQEGTVDEVGMFYTRFHTMDNRSVMMPNSKLSAVTIENFSALGERRLELVVSASYTSDPVLVIQALRKAIERCEPLQGKDRIAEFREFGDSAISYQVCLWIPSARYVSTRYALRRYVWEEFKAAGVEMTYPHVNVHVQNS